MNSPRARLLDRITAPASEPVSLADAKAFLRVEHTADDNLISGLIVTARQMAERYLRQSLITQTWKLAFDDMLEDETRLPYGPVQSVSSVRLIDASGNVGIVSASSYALNAAKTLLQTNNYISAARVEIEYIAGYGDAAAVPSPIRQGILIHVATLYDNRDASADISANALALFQTYKEMAI